MSEVLLSRIVTVYKQWDLVRRWLGDVGLRRDGVEWLVVNDAPQDPPSEDVQHALRSLGARVITPVRNLGRCSARRLGAQEASGVWIEHIDGDDRPLPFGPEDLIAAPGADLALHPVPESPSLARDEFTVPSWTPESHTYWSFLFPAFAPADARPAGVLWKREAFLALGGYDDRLQCSEDLELLWRAQNAGLKAVHNPKPKQLYYTHPSSGFHGQRDYRDSLEFFMSLRGQCDGKVRRQLDYLIGRQLIAFGRQFLGECWRHRAGLLEFARLRVTGGSATFNRR